MGKLLRERRRQGGRMAVAAGENRGWECKTAKGKGEGSVFIEKP
jgi:hypothetical protein